jgi:hypothetical protein
MDTLFGLIPLFILFGLLGGLSWLINVKYSDKIWVDRLENPITTYTVLIGWTSFGFFTNLDYIQNCGCIVSAEPIFSTENIFYSGTAMVLLSLGVFIRSRTIVKVLLICELLFWLYKLTLVKGGYAVGFGGIPSIGVLAFDTIALTLRLILIKQILQVRIKTLFLLLITFIIMTLKIQFFR